MKLAFPVLIAFAAAIVASPTAAQGNGLTVELDADSTQADGANGRIRFEGVRIRQGDMQISASVAESSGLEFEDSEWTFRGNVRFRAPDATVSSDTAVLTFRAQRLQTVALTGSPLVFEQSTDGQARLTSGTGRLDFKADKLARAVFVGEPVAYELATAERVTSSRAKRLVYDALEGVLTLEDDAWIGDGGREITGDSIRYNFREQRVLAASDEDGRVRITITPPDPDPEPQPDEQDQAEQNRESPQQP